MYRIFDVDDLIRLPARTGTLGYQPKFITNDNTFFIKEQAIVSGDLREDWVVEVFAVKVAEALGITGIIKQSPCIIRYGNKKRYGVYSDNFESYFQFCSFDSLLYLKRTDLYAYNFVKLNAVDKLRCLASLLSKYTGVALQECISYFLNLAVIDILVCNVDRHPKNFGCAVLVDGTKKIAPIFDNGMGLGEFVSDKQYCNSVADFEREAYISPYGEDPLVLLEQLHIAYNVGVKLRQCLPALRALKTARMPDNMFAKAYYSQVLKSIADLR